jgi:hypothetical protein
MPDQIGYKTFTLDRARSPKLAKMLEIRPTSHARSSVKPNASQAAPKPASVLEYPQDDVELSRNSRPVVLLHGTLVEKEGIAAYRDYALRSGHPVNYRTYQSITDGDRLEKSTEFASRQVNLSRAEVATKNVERLSEMNRNELRAAFSLNGDLYGQPDPDVEAILDRAPDIVSGVGDLLKQPEASLASSLSGQLKTLEQDYASKLRTDGLSPQKAKAVVRELVDTVAPKAIVVGHSAGGVVAYTLAVNPEETPDADPYTYDGGNGLGEVVVLSAPINKGLPKPAPPGVADLPFYNYDSQVLRPLEQLPPYSLLLSNPIVDFAYGQTKGLLESSSRLGFMMAATLTSPLTHLLRPGNEQVEENSSFFQQYIQNKEIPEGTSVIAITSPLDKLSEEDRSRLDTKQANGHTLSIDLQVSDEQIERERPTWAHVIMTEKPDSFKDQFAEHLRTDSDALVRLLNTANDDGVRHESLTMVRRQIEEEPGYLEMKPELKAALERVAEERLPFTDSPSYLAFQLLGSG